MQVLERVQGGGEGRGRGREEEGGLLFFSDKKKLFLTKQMQHPEIQKGLSVTEGYGLFFLVMFLNIYPPPPSLPPPRKNRCQS